MSTFSQHYQEDLKKFFSQVVPKGSRTTFFNGQKILGKYEYILLPNSLSQVQDIQLFVKKIKKHCYEESRIVVVYFNFLWKPLLDAASFLGLRKKEIQQPNWLSHDDIDNLFHLEGFEEIKRGKRFLFPVEIKLLSPIINNFLAQLPVINHFCLTIYQVFRPIPKPRTYSVSLIIPVRNEEGNINGILRKIPSLGEKMEVIFIEGHSKDNTYKAVEEEIKNNKHVQASLYKQKGKGKADAVRLGFSKAKNELLMILDADLTVNPEQLPKFYEAISKGHGELINGSRLVYPMEKEAMRTLNHLGNKIFSLLFTFILGQKIKDTLCGTKAVLKKDYIKIERNRKFFGNFDPFGDFDLLFGATKLNFKITEIPIRYQERKYGSTNISRFTHGWFLLKMSLFAAKKIKFI